MPPLGKPLPRNQLVSLDVDVAVPLGVSAIAVVASACQRRCLDRSRRSEGNVEDSQLLRHRHVEVVRRDRVEEVDVGYVEEGLGPNVDEKIGRGKCAKMTFEQVDR